MKLDLEAARSKNGIYVDSKNYEATLNELANLKIRATFDCLFCDSLHVFTFRNLEECLDQMENENAAKDRKLVI